MKVLDSDLVPTAKVARNFRQMRKLRTGVLTPVTLSINGTPEQFDVTAFSYVINGEVYHKATQAGIALSAIHATGIAKWLGVLVYVNAAGTITTVGLPDTGDQDHASEAAALASLVGLCPANCCPVGTITLLTNAADWDGITDAFNEADLLAANLLGYTPSTRLWDSIRPGWKFVVESVRPQAQLKSGVGSISVVTPDQNSTAVLTNPYLAVDARTVAAATNIKFRVGAFDYVIAGVAYHKAAEIAIAFTAAHAVSLDTFGVIVVQVDAAGTISTKAALTPQAYTTAALAIAAKPAPDAGNAEVGWFLIEADAGEWLANTDDMIAASDLETIEVHQTPGLNRLLGDATLTVDDAEGEDLEIITGFDYMIDGVRYSKAAAAGIDFTAAHEITASLFGAILLQIDAAGTVTSKIPIIAGKVATTAFGAATAAAALLELAHPDPGNVAIGRLEIQNIAATWTANTDDMVAGTDVTAVTVTPFLHDVNQRDWAVEAAQFPVGRALAALTLATGYAGAPTLGAAVSPILVFLAASTMVATDPSCDVEFRPQGLNSGG